MKFEIKAGLGDPIFSFDRSEIWAYWSEDRTLTQNVFKFATRSQLLEDDRRVTQVEWTGTFWRADVDCQQRDFAGTPFFFMHPLNGPEARLGAIRLLLKDPAFKSYFREDEGRLEAYAHLAEAKARRGWF